MTPRRLERGPVILPALDGALELVWLTLLDLAQHLDDVPWVLVGGQMVLLHGLERNLPAPRVSSDIDAAVDVRADPDGIRTPPAAVIVVDVLAPEGLAPTTDITTTGGRAFPSPGVTQALDRAELVPVSIGARTGWVPRPTLLGAIVAKAAAATSDKVEPLRHLVDLAFLCGLVPDPLDESSRVTKGDRQRLRAALRLLPDDHPAWIEGARDPVDARIALVILADNP